MTTQSHTGFLSFLLALSHVVLLKLRVMHAAWKARRELAALMAWDERMLKDIGVTRCDVAASLSGRWNDNPSRRLTVLAVERRAGDRARARERLARAASRTAGRAEAEDEKV